jgi:ABC-type transport system involved in multi-copper enzyme maturation permease subunit
MVRPTVRRSMIKIAGYTVADIVRQKSFVALFAICVIFVFLIRGCYHGNYVVNGQALDAGTIIVVVSKLAFHVVAVGAMLIVALFSMRALRRDRDEGMQSAILSKPITRRQYVTGKIAGLWGLSTCFMFVLHGIVFMTALVTSKVVLPGYLAASLLCSFNLLFVIVAVLLLSLFLPDIVAFLSVVGIGVVGLILDGMYALSHSEIVNGPFPAPSVHPQPGVTWWDFLYRLWPKLYGAQQFASSLIGAGRVDGEWNVYPLVNVLLYCVVFGALLLWRFGHEEVV